MPNDPNKLLKQDEDAAFEAFYREILREFGPESPVQTGKKPASRTRTPARKKKKEKGLRALAVTLCLECAGIAAIAAWWMVRIL